MPGLSALLSMVYYWTKYSLFTWWYPGQDSLSTDQGSHFWIFFSLLGVQLLSVIRLQTSSICQKRSKNWNIRSHWWTWLIPWTAFVQLHGFHRPYVSHRKIKMSPKSFCINCCSNLIAHVKLPKLHPAVSALKLQLRWIRVSKFPQNLFENVVEKQKRFWDLSFQNLSYIFIHYATALFDSCQAQYHVNFKGQVFCIQIIMYLSCGCDWIRNYCLANIWGSFI